MTGNPSLTAEPIVRVAFGDANQARTRVSPWIPSPRALAARSTMAMMARPMTIGAFFRRLTTVHYAPAVDHRPYLERAVTQCDEVAEVTVAALGPKESAIHFGVPMARRDVQPVWLKVVNRSDVPLRLSLVGISASYYTPLEAAAVNHFSVARRLAGFGLAAWLFLPLIAIVPLKMISARGANRRMDALFQQEAFRLRPIAPGAESSGFVFTPLDEGRKSIRVRLLGRPELVERIFSVDVPGLDTDHRRRDLAVRAADGTPTPCEPAQLVKRLGAQPRATTNRRGAREGDPVNLVIIGDFDTVLDAFGARWDETETITLGTCWKTMKSFLLGSEYRYSPVSSLYLFGRSQDVALQRIRGTLNERLHLRLWSTSLRFEDQPVWVGQVSRDIGVRFTWRTWNLTTHRVDPDVDEARDYVLEDLLAAEHVDRAIYVGGVGACDERAPRANLTGDPYFTDGNRVVVALSKDRVTPRFVRWDAAE